jgi:hypothetical protein
MNIKTQHRKTRIYIRAHIGIRTLDRAFLGSTQPRESVQIFRRFKNVILKLAASSSTVYKFFFSVLADVALNNTCVG